MHNSAELLLLNKAGVILNPRKCIIFGKKIDYPEHIIQPGKLELPDHATDQAGDLKLPRGVTKMK